MHCSCMLQRKNQEPAARSAWFCSCRSIAAALGLWLLVKVIREQKVKVLNGSSQMNSTAAAAPETPPVLPTAVHTSPAHGLKVHLHPLRDNTIPSLPFPRCSFAPYLHFGIVQTRLPGFRPHWWTRTVHALLGIEQERLQQSQHRTNTAASGAQHEGMSPIGNATPPHLQHVFRQHLVVVQLP